jgi:hypothetical protein
MQGLDPLTRQCVYSTPCGWCAKWDKKCDKKIGCGNSGDIGQRGMIGICPNCGRSGCISWNLDTDVSTCSCGWNNDKPQRGLRAKGNLIEDAVDFTYGKCFDCKHDGWPASQCTDCNPENGFKYFESKE